MTRNFRTQYWFELTILLSQSTGSSGFIGRMEKFIKDFN